MRQTAMIITPNIFCQIEWQSVVTNASLGHQSAFKVAPESFQPIDVVLPRSVVAFGVMDQTVDISFRSDPGIALPSVGVDDRPPPDMPTYQGPQRAGMHIRNDFRPDLATPTEDSEDRSLGGPTASFRAQCSLALSLVLPGSTHIGLIDFDFSLKHGRNFPRHALSQEGQGPQNSLPMQARFLGDNDTARTPHKPPQEVAPFAGGQTKRPTVRSPVVTAYRTTTPISLQYPVLTTLTPRTSQSSRHATMIPH